ncbi:hypothetical protein ACHAPT_006993 [Fusarium lateritium]
MALSGTFYRRYGKAIFLQGLETADVGILERCERFGVASADYKWVTPARKFTDLADWYLDLMAYPGSKFPYGRKAAPYHRPIDRLLVSAFKGETIRENHYRALKWLMDRDYDASSGNEELLGEHMVRSLPSQLQRVRDRESMRNLSRMIRLVSNRGFPTPCTKFALDILPENARELPNYLVSSGDYPEKRVDVDDVRASLVSLSMRAHCPPSVLQVVLGDYERRGAQLNTEYLDPPTRLKEYDDMDSDVLPHYLEEEGYETYDPTVWWHACRMEDLLGSLYSDCFGLWGWTEAYPGEAADIFSQKLELLVDYDAVTEPEEYLLKAVLEAMRGITALQEEGALTGLALRKAAWEKLWTAVIPFRLFLTADLNYKHRRISSDIKRFHRFAFDSSRPFNPWGAWYMQHEMMSRQERWDPISPEAFERALKEDEEWQKMWRRFWRTEKSVQWYNVSMDEWLNMAKMQDSGEFDEDDRFHSRWPGFFHPQGATLIRRRSHLIIYGW